MKDDDEDPVESLQRFLDELLIYKPGSLLEVPPSRPFNEELKAVESETFLRVLTLLKRYVRPRNEVLGIRKAVNAAFRDDRIQADNIYSQHNELRRELEQLKVEKSVLEEELRTIRGRPANANDAQNSILGNMLLQSSMKQLQILRIYKEHLGLLLGKQEEVENQTTLSRAKELAYLVSPSASARRDSAVISEEDLRRERDSLLRSLQSSKPKQILQSLAFLSTLVSQSLTKHYSTTSKSPSKRTAADKLQTDAALLPLKQEFLANCEKLITLQSTLANFPKKEYATVEAKCRALRAAKAEALDRLDEIISSNEPQCVNEDWDEDVKAAKELIEQRVTRIKILVYRYHDLRAEVQNLAEEAKACAMRIFDDPSVSRLISMEISKSSEWAKLQANQTSQGSPEDVTLSQLESAMHAKWKIESAQILHESMASEIASALKFMKNETLYNLTIESPLLRDADILDDKSIVETWRDASLHKRVKLRDWFMGKAKEDGELTDLAEKRLEMVRTLQREGQALRTLGDDVL